MFRAPFPIVDKDKENYQSDFKMKIIKYIVYRRIFKDSDMQMLLKQLIHKNRNYLKEDEINEIFESVKEELEK